ncbi:MAG: tRNA-dihydrouridine synthase [Patescibacteria group bacterium]
MQNFWEKLPKPIMALAPMANVTDAAFRQIIAKYSGPTACPNGFKTGRVMWTEFVSADGLMSRGREALLHDLKYSEIERPIVAQLFGANLEKMAGAAKLVAELGFDGLDINMGCPDKTIEKQNAGAKLIQNPQLAREIIRAAKRGVKAAGREIPISVKTRLGYSKDELETWLPELLAEDLAAITIHARTRKEMSKVPARWERIKRAVEIRNELKSKTLILGNGDVENLEQARKKVEETGCDGVMFGRVIFGQPWKLANPAELYAKWGGSEPSVEIRLQIMLEHTKLFEELLGGIKSFSIMKKHFKAYLAGFPDVSELRAKLMVTTNASEVETLVKEFLL